jgi:hypothetical protein
MPGTTLVIFPDRQLSPDLWTAIFASLRTELASARPETDILRTGSGSDPADIQLLRSDEVHPGLSVGKSISVYLHGNCDFAPQLHSDTRPRFGSIPLGWVQMEAGHIAPFAHVNCENIQRVLWSQMVGCPPDRRTERMGLAIARVILHEWIHVANQSSLHPHHGLTKSQFNADDLIAFRSDPRPRKQVTE